MGRRAQDCALECGALAGKREDAVHSGPPHNTPPIPRCRSHCGDQMGPLSLDLAQCMKQTALAGECWSQLAQGWAALLEGESCSPGLTVCLAAQSCFP